MFTQVHVTCGSEILLIGDSHTLLSGAHQTFGDLDVHARLGRDSSEGLRVLAERLRPRHRVVVFDLATNDIGDPGLFEANLEMLHERTGDRGLVVVNTWRRDGANRHGEVNEVQADFTERHPERTTQVDWAAYIDDHPEALTNDPDYVHFTLEAYDHRTRMIRQAIAHRLSTHPHP